MTDIYHSGIKGQKKGVRRYQYLNGTYTREGNLRYRPPKGDNDAKIARRIITGSMLGEVALVAIKNAQSNASSQSAIEAAKNAILNLNANSVAVGKAVVETVLKVPAPVRAMVLPIMAIGAGATLGYAIVNHEAIGEYIRELPWNKIANTTISLGASAAGVALSTVSGNPLPAIAGMTISTLATLMDQEY